MTQPGNGSVVRPDSTLVEPQADDPMPYLVSLIAGGNFASPAYYIPGTIKRHRGSMYSVGRARR